MGRSECTGDGLQGDRSTWTPWKVPKPQLSLVRYDQSFVMVAAHQGSYGKLEFRGCTLEESAEACPFDDRVVAKPPPKKHAAVWKSKFYGAFVRRVRAESSRRPPRHRRCSPLDRARTAASSPRNDLVKNTPDGLVDFHTGTSNVSRAARPAAKKRPARAGAS